jgi:hypothetical protein
LSRVLAHKRQWPLWANRVSSVACQGSRQYLDKRTAGRRSAHPRLGRLRRINDVGDGPASRCVATAMALSSARLATRSLGVGGVPRSTKMGNIASPWRYDTSAYCAPRYSRLRKPAISHFALWPNSLLLHLNNATSSIAAGAARLCQIAVILHLESTREIFRAGLAQPSISRPSAIRPA